MHRTDHVSFVETNEINLRKAYCEKCEEKDGIFNKLVPRVKDGLIDEKFRICSFCGAEYPIFDVKFTPEYEPKGYISDNPFDTGAKVGIKDDRRKARKLYRNKPLPNEDVEIPKFAGRKDKLIEDAIQEGAIVHSIEDSWDQDDV